MLKNKWFIAALALGLVVTVAYNLSYFASRGKQPTPSEAASSMTAAGLPQGSIAITNSIGTGQPPEKGASEALARPPLSLSVEEIAQQAQNPLALPVKRDPSVAQTYPERDPFQDRRAMRLTDGQTESKATPSAPGEEADASVTEPAIRVTAILIHGERRLAVINGYPKRIGASVGPWQIAAIERDYVMVRTPDGHKKIEIDKQVADANTKSDP